LTSRDIQNRDLRYSVLLGEITADPDRTWIIAPRHVEYTELGVRAHDLGLWLSEPDPEHAVLARGGGMGLVPLLTRLASRCSMREVRGMANWCQRKIVSDQQVCGAEGCCVDYVWSARPIPPVTGPRGTRTEAEDNGAGTCTSHRVTDCLPGGHLRFALVHRVLYSIGHSRFGARLIKGE
jgi:hypothetical protein